MPVPRTLTWIGELPGKLRLIDQTRLPVECQTIDCESVEQVWEAIRSLRVRGAPAIGCSAAYGVILGIQDETLRSTSELLQRLAQTAEYLASSRPTAVNLFWALDRMRRVATQNVHLDRDSLRTRLLQEARAIEDEDRAMCSAIGRHGATLLPDRGGVLTHCNAGGLATAGDGTALAVIFEAVASGKQIHVFADETRPLLQGARLTSWELQQRGIPVTVICDSMAALVMRDKRVHAVVVGADRIAANGDTANKVGTYSVAVLARAHGVPFYVAAPSSTFDLSLESGAGIPLEERKQTEITHGFGSQTVPDEVNVWNPAFDVTPAQLIAGIITERGVILSPTVERVRAMIGS